MTSSSGPTPIALSALERMNLGVFVGVVARAAGG
jgi:hypothetical protein